MTAHIKFLSGAAICPGKLTLCHSGKPKANRCWEVSHAPGRDGWTLVQNPPGQRHRDGWWCPDCTQQLQEMMAKHGVTVVESRDIPLAPEGTA